MNKYTITATRFDGSRFGYTKDGVFSPTQFLKANKQVEKLDVCLQGQDPETNETSEISLSFHRGQFRPEYVN
jgi:hypothetical protein